MKQENLNKKKTETHTKYRKQSCYSAFPTTCVFIIQCSILHPSFVQ